MSIAWMNRPSYSNFIEGLPLRFFIFKSMKQENVRILVATALGATAGLLLGMYLFSEEEKKGKLSQHLESLSDLAKKLEDLKTDEAKELKDKVKNIMKSVQELLDQKNGKPE
jgi:hypothetical protein